LLEAVDFLLYNDARFIRVMRKEERDMDLSIWQLFFIVVALAIMTSAQGMLA